MLLPEQIRWIDKQLKRLEGLNVPPEQKEAVRKELERLKSQDVVIDHLNPRFLNFKRKIDKETSVIFCAVGTEFSSFIHLL
jgi:hypothetical protein